MSIPAHHVDSAILCNKSYDTNQSDIWSVRENDVLVKERDNLVDLAVRGTEFSKSVFYQRNLAGLSNTVDILKDVRFWPYSMAHGSVHKGFGRGAEVWCDKFGKQVAAFNKPVRIQGHSLGAAISGHLAILLWVLGVDVHEVVMYGEPASFYGGSELNYQALGIPTTSYLNSNDWIRFAPPWGSTSVERTYLNQKSGVSKVAHNITEYMSALKSISMGFSLPSDTVQ